MRRYTYNCTSCGEIAHTTRAADLRNRSGRRCQNCKSQASTVSAPLAERVCRQCGCTDSRACQTITGPCAWIEIYDDNTGICTACPNQPPTAGDDAPISGAAPREGMPR